MALQGKFCENSWCVYPLPFQKKIRALSIRRLKKCKIFSNRFWTLVWRYLHHFLFLLFVEVFDGTLPVFCFSRGSWLGWTIDVDEEVLQGQEQREKFWFLWFAVLKREQAPINTTSSGFPVNDGMSLAQIHINMSKTQDRDFPCLLWGMHFASTYICLYSSKMF